MKRTTHPVIEHGVEWTKLVRLAMFSAGVKAIAAVNDFALTVIALLRYRALRDRLGTTARRPVEALFSVEAHAAGVLGAYGATSSRRSVAA